MTAKRPSIDSQSTFFMGKSLLKLIKKKKGDVGMYWLYYITEEKRFQKKHNP